MFGVNTGARIGTFVERRAKNVLHEKNVESVWASGEMSPIRLRNETTASF